MSEESKPKFLAGWIPKSRAEWYGFVVGAAIAAVGLFVWPYPAWPIWRLWE